MGKPHTFVAVDFETGTNERDSAVSLGMVRVEDYQIVGEPFYELICPPEPPDGFGDFQLTNIHGISWSDVENSPTWEGWYPKILEYIDGAEFLVCHSVGFDRTVWYACCKTYSIVPPKLAWRDTVVLARNMWHIKPATLNNICVKLGIDLVRHHDARDDCEACAKIVIAAHQEKQGVADGAR